MTETSSFTLFETLISILILSIILVSFSKTSLTTNFDKEYMLLNNIENSFTTGNYDKNFIKNKKYIKIKTNSLEKRFKIDQIIYKSKNLSLRKYQLIK